MKFGFETSYQYLDDTLKGPFGWNGEKVERQKMVRGWKSERIEKILISLIFVWLEVKKWKDKKS